MYISSVEMATIGSYPNAQACNPRYPAYPRDRHNHYEFKSVTTLHKKADGTPINACQKPKELWKKIISVHAPPGSWVLVIGTGAGGEVEGAIEAGCNVVGVEYDEIQWQAFSAHLILSEEKAIKERDAERKRKDLEAKRKDSPASQSTVSSQPSPPHGAVDQGDASVLICSECNEQAIFGDDEDIRSCTLCPSTNLHPNCCIQGYHGLICVTCNDKLLEVPGNMDSEQE